MKLKDTPIKAKLMRVILMTCGAVLIVSCTTYFIYELFTYRSTTRRNLSLVGRVIAANCTAALAFESREDANEILNALKADRRMLAAALYDVNGKLFAVYPQGLDKKMLPSIPGDYKYLFKNEILEGFQPVIQGDRNLGALYLKADMREMYRRLKLFGLIALHIILGSFLFAYFLSRRLQKTISQPILDLAGTARLISENKDYHVRAKKSGDDELGLLTDAFNHMLDQIEIKNSEIVGFNQKLEQRILERTNELEFAYHVLQQQNQFVETIIDSSIDVIVVMDRELRYVIMNTHAEGIYGVNRSEILGKSILDVFPQLKGTQMIEDMNRALNGETIHNLDYASPILHRKYEIFYIPLRDNENQIYRVLVIAHDVTNIIEANEKLKLLNGELKKSNNDLEQFASVASHDLQEPLRKIQTFSDLAQNRTTLDENGKVYLAKINSSAERMGRLIQAVLNYSRLSNSTLQEEIVDLGEVLKIVTSDLELIIQEKEALISSSLLPAVRGIPLQLNQLFLNLISNALKFSEQKPKINVSCRFISGEDVENAPDLDAQCKYVELVFKDNGIGFDQQLSEKVFVIFQRLHTRSKYPGTGIGLALCKKIVENHHGTINVVSEPGKGSAFYVYLPAQTE